MRRLTLQDVSPDQLRGRTVLVRFDLNVPVSEGKVQDDTRLDAALPTLRQLLDADARVVLLSHFGRPKGVADPAFSLAPVAGRLSELLGRPVPLAPGWRGPAVAEQVGALGEGTALLLENTRFDPGETANDPALAADWAAWTDLYVNDAFGAAHRAHASTAGVAEAVKAQGGMALGGLLMEKELRFLAGALADPDRPFVAVLGGAKISGKIEVVEALLDRVDRLLIGGAMANTFFLALGLEVGRSLVEEDRVEMARALLERAGDRLMLPVDCVVASSIGAEASTSVCARDSVPADQSIGDIGPKSVALFADELATAQTIVWNGPMGVFELPAFAEGTVEVAAAVARASDGGALTVVGGGDSAAAADAAGVTERMTHISTGGGASLELLAGKALPGVESLSQAGED